jgi:hypothetical protein
MSIIQKLTEGIVNRDMKKEGQALLNKWGATGLLEGLGCEQKKHTMARLLENQAKELLREASSMGSASGGGVEGFAAVAFPIVRRVFAGLIANDLVSVQPMSLPSGLIFFLDFVYSPNIGATADQEARFGNLASASVEQSIYGTDKVGSQITGGVNIVGSTNKEEQSGPRGMVGYAYASATGSFTDTIANNDATESIIYRAFILDGAVTEANKKLIKYDPDLLAVTDSSLGVIILDIEQDKFTNPDNDNLAAFAFPDITDDVAKGTANSFGAYIEDWAAVTLNAITDIDQIRRLTQKIDSASDAGTTEKCYRFVLSLNVAGSSALSALTSATAGAGNDVLATTGIQYPTVDTATSTADSGGAITSFTMPMEMEAEIPEIDIKVDSIAIVAQTKKLKAKWSPELGQDLNAYHNLDAEVELTSILSEQIALEIDREILADLVNGATAAVYYWSRAPGLFVDRVNGSELGATSAAPDFTGTVSEWYETLIETINDVSAQIHVKTLRGGANFVVCSPEVANILEFTSGFRANVTADADKGDIGAVKAGSLNRKFDVMVDPYFPRNVILVGRKGNSFLESGYVYAPYVPLQTTPTIFGVEDFVPRKGVMTRYAKKMVRPDMYGLVIVRGLLGEAGS